MWWARQKAVYLSYLFKFPLVHCVVHSTFLLAKMPSPWICVLLCLAIVGGCGGDERRISDIHKVKEEMKKSGNDDGEDGGSTSSHEEEEWHNYEGIRTKGENYTSTIDREHENEDREQDTIGKSGTEWRLEEKRNEEVNKGAGNPFETKYVPKQSTNERKQVERARGNGARQKKRGESLEKQRQNTIIEKKEMKKRKAVKGRGVGRKKKTKREGTERQRNNRGRKMRRSFEGGGLYQRYGNYKIEQRRKVESKIGRRRGGRRLKGQRKRNWKGNGKRYYNKYGYENERNKGYRGNTKHRGSKKRPVHKNVEYGRRGWKSQGKEKKKRKGRNYGKYFRKHVKKVRFRSRYSFRRKRKGRIFNRKGKKGKSWCSLSRYNMSTNYIKQLMHAFAHNRVRYMQNSQKCRGPELYMKRFGAVGGYRKWLRCWQMLWRKLAIKTARYPRKKKPAKCE